MHKQGKKKLDIREQVKRRRTVPSRVVILSGPSGVGKDTVLSRWKELNPNVSRVVSYTTRKPRKGEVNGQDYHFVTVECFLTMLAQKKFLEAKEVHGNWYGTPIGEIQRLEKDGHIVVLKIDVEGAHEILSRNPAVMSIFLLPPNMDELKRRIVERGLNTEEDMRQRLITAEWEIDHQNKYKHCIVNEVVDDTARRIDEIVREYVSQAKHIEYVAVSA